MKNRLIKAILTALVLLLQACGGSSSSGFGGENPGGAGNINPDLPGKFLFSNDWNNHSKPGDDRRDGAVVMDIKTGEYTRIPNTHWAEIFEQSGDAGARSNMAHPVPNTDSMFLVQSAETLKIVDGAIEFYVLVLLQDFQGNILNFFRIFLESDSDILMAHDHQHMAVNSGGDLKIIKITSNALEITDILELPITSSFAWLPDNRLVYVYGDNRRQFVITEPLSVKSNRVLSIPSSVNGEVGEISVSPSGDKIAFILKDSGNETPWIVNIEGTGFRQLAKSGDTNSQIFGQLQWSPDGEYIMVSEPYFGDLTNPDTFIPPSRYVIPSGKDVVYITSEKKEVRSPEVIRLKFKCDSGSTSCDNYRFSAPTRDLFWIQ